jgi:putative ABC transport system permease protein
VVANLLNDFRYAMRQLRKSPGFALTAILTLALGIGAVTAIFSVVEGVLLRPLPFRDFGRLTYLQIETYARGEKKMLGVNPALYRLFQQRCGAFQDMAAYQGGTLGLAHGKGGTPKEIGVLWATNGFFHVLGSAPMLGRSFTPAEFSGNGRGHSNVTVISDALWRRDFHSDKSILGKAILLNGEPFTVIGIMPPSFRIPQELMGYSTSGVRHGADAYMPLTLPTDSTDPLSDWNYFAVARLRAGVPPAEANAQMNAVIAPLVAKLGGDARAEAEAVPLLQAITGDAASGLWLLFAAVGSVLLIACINLANLQLARARVRAHEHAVRAALGASGGRLFQYSLMESMVLAVAGGVGGISLAFAGVKLFLMLAPRNLPRIGQVHVRWETLAVAALLSIGTGMFFGIAPALAALRADPQHAMHEGGRRTVGAHGGRRFGFTLIALEAIACTVLLMAAALLTRSFQHLLSTDLGFSPRNVVVAEVNLGDKRFTDTQSRVQFYERILPVLRRLPGVTSASYVSALPMQGDMWVDSLDIPGDTRPAGIRPNANLRWISPDYLHAMGVPLVSGRMLTAADRDTDNVVISQAAAHAAWPDRNSLGRKFDMGSDHATVVGVVGDTRSRGLTDSADRMVYLPYWRMTQYSATGYLMVRTSGDPKVLTDAIQHRIWSVDPAVPIPEIRTLPDVIQASVSLQHFEMLLLLAFGLAALGLAALGIYGVLAVTVAERKRDLAMRIALGGDKQRVFRLVLKQGMSPVVTGLVIGLGLAWALARTAQTLLPDVAPADPISTAITVVLLLAVALAACFIPARRAASVDPMTILRSE